MEKETDEYCQKIFIVFTMTDRKMRFNELHRQINKYGLKISKPTLIQHLKHLQKQKTIRRIQKDKQVVFYELNWKRLEQLRKAKKINEAALHYVIDEKTFKSKPLHQQINFTLDMLFLKELSRLKLAALYILEPKQRLQLLSTLSYINLLYTMYTKWLFNSVTQSKENGQQILEAIDDTIDKLTEPFLKESQEPTPQKT